MVVVVGNVVATGCSMVPAVDSSKKVVLGEGQKLGVLEQGLLIRRLLVQRLLLVQKLRKPIEENVALRTFMFQSV